jgi:hypothetical protein
MTRAEIEAILKSAQAKNDKEGHTLPDGASVTLHVAHDGASVSIQKVEAVRFDGELVYARSSKQTVALVASDVFAVAIEGGNGSPRRPAGFL